MKEVLRFSEGGPSSLKSFHISKPRGSCSLLCHGSFPACVYCAVQSYVATLGARPVFRFCRVLLLPGDVRGSGPCPSRLPARLIRCVLCVASHSSAFVSEGPLLLNSFVPVWPILNGHI